MSYPVYRFYANAEDAAHDRDSFLEVTSMTVWENAAAIAQRPLSYPSLKAQLRRTGRIYIAGNRASGGRSFCIRRIES